MKNLLLLMTLFLSSVITQAATYYVSPTGSDSNPGTLLAPFKTLTKASTVLAALPSKGAGDIVYVRGGTYGGWPNTPTNGYAYMLLNNLKGTASSPCTFINYPGEKPVFDFTGVVITSTRPSPTGISIFNSDHLNFKGMRFTGLKQITNGSGVSRGLELYNSTWCVIEQVEIDHFQGTAFFGSNGVFDCTFLNCDAHHNDDRLSADGTGVPGSDAWDNADGFGFTGAGNTSDRITFDGCRAWLNCDDGWDNFGTNGSRIWKNCWSFWNGYYQDPGMGTRQPAGNGQGFKLGPTGQDLTGIDNLRVLQNCISFENKAHGFDQNGQVTTRMKMFNCTAYGNGGYGFQFQYYPVSPGLILHTLKNNAALSNGSGNVNLASASPVNIANNTWNGAVSITSADFQSVSSAGVDGPRQADGSLPNLSFLKLNTSSDLVNAGVNVGLSYLSSAPDLGAYESTGTTSNITPTANAGTDLSISLPVSTVTLAGAGTDPDGTIATYAWTKISGPTGPVITSAASASTTVTGLLQGTYQYQLAVTDNKGAIATDLVQVTVNAAGNNLPVANAGTDTIITLPASSISLRGTGTDIGGTIASYSWTKISGPTSGTITTATAANTTVTGLVQGLYKWELKVTDNSGGIGKDTVVTTVNASTTTTLKVIRVNIYGNTVTYNNTKWNNWKSSGGTTSTAFKYENQTASTVKAVFSRQIKILDNGATYMSGATICPPAVLRYASANQNSRTLTLTGLDPAKLYSFEFFASSALSGNTTQFLINGIGYDINTYNNQTAYAGFINVKPASNGSLIVYVLTKAGAWNYVSAFTIIEQTGTVTSVPVTSAARSVSGEPEAGIETAAIANSDVTVFPVPFASSFTISLNNEITGTYKLALLDVSGKVVWKKEVSKTTAASATETIYMGNLPTGAYILQVTDPEQNTTTQTLIKN